MADEMQLEEMFIACALFLTDAENDAIGRAISERREAFQAALSAACVGKRMSPKMFAEAAARCARMVLDNQGVA